MPEDKEPKEPRSFKPGEKDGFQTDTFSRNDREGRPSLEEMAGDDSAGDRASSDEAPDTDGRAAADDRDSRDATPPRPAPGGLP
jgi:hypothetical protein